MPGQSNEKRGYQVGVSFGICVKCHHGASGSSVGPNNLPGRIVSPSAREKPQRVASRIMQNPAVAATSPPLLRGPVLAPSVRQTVSCERLVRSAIRSAEICLLRHFMPSPRALLRTQSRRPLLLEQGCPQSRWGGTFLGTNPFSAEPIE